MALHKMTFPLATALRTALPKYNKETFRHDLVAGLIVSLVALPLAMALSIAVGLPPRHGLYTAIIAGLAAAIFGGSSTQVSGPTAAFVVIVAPIVTQYGLNGLLICEIIAGLLLVTMGLLKLGRFVSYVPYTVVTGFTSGIAIVIGTLALNDFLGLDIPALKGEYIEKVATLFHHLGGMNPQEFIVGLVTLATIFLFPRITHKVPAPVVGISLGALVAYLFNSNGHEVATLMSRFTYETAEGLHHGIQPYPPAFHAPAPTALLPLIKPALIIAALAALESLLSATAADGMAKTKHDPNAELTGIGIANIFSGFTLGLPATGAIARTATNIHAGAKTPVASAFHALFILLYVVTLAPYISYAPMAALSALLISTAWRMSHAHQFIHIVKTAPKTDVIILLGCFIPTIFIDMVWGVGIGMALTGLFATHKLRKDGLKRAARDGQKEEE